MNSRGARPPGCSRRAPKVGNGKEMQLRHIATDAPIRTVPGDAITERMLLRPFTEADLGWLTALHGDPAVMRYIDTPVPAEVVAAVTLPILLREQAELPAGVGHFAAL